MAESIGGQLLTTILSCGAMRQSRLTVINLGSMLNIYKILLNFLHFARDFAQNICAIENGTVQKIKECVTMTKKERKCTVQDRKDMVYYGTNKGVLGNRKYKGYTTGHKQGKRCTHMHTVKATKVSCNFKFTSAQFPCTLTYTGKF